MQSAFSAGFTVLHLCLQASCLVPHQAPFPPHLADALPGREFRTRGWDLTVTGCMVECKNLLSRFECCSLKQFAYMFAEKVIQTQLWLWGRGLFVLFCSMWHIASSLLVDSMLFCCGFSLIVDITTLWGFRRLIPLQRQATGSYIATESQSKSRLCFK